MDIRWQGGNCARLDAPIRQGRIEWAHRSNLQRRLNQRVAVSGNHTVAGSISVGGMSGLLAKGCHGENDETDPESLGRLSLIQKPSRALVVVTTMSHRPRHTSLTECVTTSVTEPTPC